MYTFNREFLFKVKAKTKLNTLSRAKSDIKIADKK